MDQGRRITAALLAAGLLGAAAQSAGAAVTPTDATMCGAAGDVASATGFALPPACVEAAPAVRTAGAGGGSAHIPTTFCWLAADIVGITGYPMPPECASTGS
jgi:hypothetical protein